MTHRSFLLAATSALLLISGCSGAKKIDIPLSAGSVHQLEPSGRLKVFPQGSADTPKDAAPMNHLRVKRQNQGAGATTAGCWQCSDCICKPDDCTCTECTSC